MNLSDPNQRRVFFELHTDLPREGPGNRDSTTRALRLMGTLPDQPLLVDIACGPGAQTLDLAQLLPDARIVATDAHKPYLDELNRRIEATGAGNRIETRLADMRALPFQPNSIDVMWCEGAAYIVGVPDALAAWAPLLKPGGRIALTEPVWLRPDPPEVVRRNWEEYPAMTDVPACRAIVAARTFQQVALPKLTISAITNSKSGRLSTSSSGARPARRRARVRGEQIRMEGCSREGTGK